MKRIRIILCLSMVVMLLMAITAPAFATEDPNLEGAEGEPTPPIVSESPNTFLYEIGDLELTLYVPSNYTTVTRDTPQGSQEFVDLDLYYYDDFIQAMSDGNQFLYAQDINSLVGISLFAWPIPDSIQDFRECLDYELKKIGKDSMENFNENGLVTYKEYSITKLEHITYITFEGEYAAPDADGMKYSYLAVSFIKGNEVQIEMLSSQPFTDQQIADMHKMLENSITPEFSSNRLLMEILRFIALGALAIALIVVILVFISSQSKTKKMEREALRQAREQEAQREAEPETEITPQPKQEIKMAYDTDDDEAHHEPNANTEHLEDTDSTDINA